MEQGYGQQRRTRPDERARQYQESPRKPATRPYDGYPPRPPVQLQATPRPYQHKQGSAYRDPSRHEMQDGDSPLMRQNPYHMSSQQHPSNSSRDNYPHGMLKPALRSPGRHLSHISALSSPSMAVDSRPISQIESEYQPAPESVYAPTEFEAEGTLISTHASLGKKGKPTMNSVKMPQRAGATSRDSETLPPSDQAATMEALTQAIRQGLDPSKKASRSTTPKPLADPGHPTVRMPFQGEPSSPTSVYTAGTTTKRNSMPLSSYQGYNPRDSKPSTIEEQVSDDYEKFDYIRDPPTPGSMHPILNDQLGIGAKLPAHKRPPRLNIEAVREAEARGSMTSLTDLIRRATKVASNLDRGRTASRLGHLDMFGSSEKLEKNKVRGSTYSDVLAAFPQPDGTGTPGRDRPNTMWPHGEKQFMASKSSLGRQLQADEVPKRKCCGMSPRLFVLVLVVVILLIAAAVLVPVFLVVLPNQRKGADTADCKSSSPCQNGGTSVVLTGACSCVCVDGFTGSDCSTQADPDCVSASFTDGATTYENATVGSSVLPLLQKETFGVPLNITTILSTFASNNLSCASENSLVDFDLSTSQRTKRSADVFSTMSPEKALPVLHLPFLEREKYKRFVIVDGLEHTTERQQLAPTPTLNRRQDVTQSTNGIVFATSTDNAAPAVTAAAAGTDSASASATASTSSAAPSQTGKIDITDSQLSFAGAVILYIMQDNQISAAVSANQAIASHFQDSDPNNSTVEVLGGKNGIEINLDTFELMFGNGTTIGGTG